jgi:photosystem II stability/assembly factor-like uncharacterized protein
MRSFSFEILNPRGRRARAGRFLLPPVFCLLLSAFCLLPAPVSAATWSRQKSGTFAWLHAVFFVDGRRGWAAGGKGALLSTEDGGASWKLRTPPPTEDALRDIFFADELHGWAVCERDWFRLRTKEEARSYLLRTEDGGRTWARVEVTGAEVDARLVGVRFAGREHGWAFGEMGALYATADGGRTWARQRVPTRRLLLGAAFLDAQKGWLVGPGPTALYTSDGGATWREGSVPSAGARVQAVSFVGARRGWAVGARGLVLATEDGGRTWRAQESGVESDLYDVKFLDEREGWAVGGEGAVIHTSDGGATWVAENPVTPHTLERLYFAGRTRGWAVGFGGTIIAFGDSR